MYRVSGLLVGLVLLGCGSGDANGDESGNAPPEAMGGAGSGNAGGEPSVETAPACDGPFLPMVAGNRWSYRVTDPVNGESMKTSTVMGLEPVGGSGPNAATMAFHVVTNKTSGAGMDMTESWQGVLEDDTVVRYREIAYQAGAAVANGEDFWEPHKLRIDEAPEHTTAGASWQEQYTETKVQMGLPTQAPRNDGWTVDGVDVPCGPVNGLMYSCLRVRKTVDGAATGKTYLFSRCVGKVREEGTQTEELVDFEVN